METMSDQPRDPAAEPEEGRIVVITPDGMGVASPMTGGGGGGGGAEADARQGREEGNPADLVIDTTGSADGFRLARRLVRPGGVLALKSTYAGDIADFDISSLVVDEITLLGSRCGPFAPAIRLLATGAIAVQPLIHARYNLNDGVAALVHAEQPGVLKVLIEA